MLHSTVVLFEEREKEGAWSGRTKPLATDKATTIRKVEDSFIVANNSIR